jgi:hypothetical protein
MNYFVKYLINKNEIYYINFIKRPMIELGAFNELCD